MMSVKKSVVGTSQFRNAAVSALVACGCGALFMPVPAAADARLEATKTDRGGVIALEWPVPVKVETERDVKTRELLLRFDQPLGTVSFSRIQEVLGGMVEAVEYGYDSVLIRVAPDVRVTPTNLASGVQIALSGAVDAPAGKSPTQSAPQPGQSLTQADYLYVSALEAMGNKPELVRFWSGKLEAGVLSEKEATGAVHRLIALGADAQALPYLKSRARERKGAWLYAYADAAERVGAGARDQFADFLEADLRRRDLSDAEVDERVALFYTRNPPRAVTSLSARALARGGASAAVHIDALIKLGQNGQATDFMTRLAANPRLSGTERRAFAFRLLEMGARKPAEAAYREIAATEPPDGPDMRQLLFLWGPRPGAEALDWIQRRYRAATTTRDRRVWIGYLVDLGGAARAVAVIEAEGPAGLSEMREPYIAALAELNDNAKLGAAISAAARVERDPDQLVRYAQLAEYCRQPQAAAQVWAAVLAVDPNHPLALKQAAAIAFATGRLDDAEKHFDRLLSAQQGDFESNQLYAELLTARKKAGAEVYYRRALDRLAETPKRTEASYLAEARIRARIKDPAGVTAVFDKLLKEHPPGPGLLAQYADLLIKAGRPDLALNVLKAGI
jgi:cellulose synthase operon protein C